MPNHRRSLFLAKIDGDNVSIENIHRFDNVSYSANGALFWDIINIYKEMNVGIKKAIEMTDDQIDSFAIDSFSNDFGLIDKNGQLLRYAATVMSVLPDMQTRFTASFQKKSFMNWVATRMHSLTLICN